MSNFFLSDINDKLNNLLIFDGGVWISTTISPTVFPAPAPAGFGGGAFAFGGGGAGPFGFGAGASLACMSKVLAN